MRNLDSGTTNGRGAVIRLGVLTALVALAPALARADDSSPETVMARLIQLLAVSDHCSLPVSQEDRTRLGDAGQRLQEKLGLTDEAVDAISEGIVRDAEDVDCTGLDADFEHVLRSTIEEAERIK